MTARRTLTDLGVALLAIAAIAAVLEVWSRVFRVPSYLLPAPSAVAARMATDAGLLAREGGITLSEAAAGFVIGTGVAFALATAMAWSRPLERTLFPLAILVKLTPIVAIAPLFTLWFGFGTAPKVAIAALITFFPMLVNSFVGSALPISKRWPSSRRSVHQGARSSATCACQARFPICSLAHASR